MSGTCNVCNGRGSLTCNKCDGQGGIRCFKCDGSGYIATPVTGLGDRATWRHDVAPERGSRPCHKCEGKGVLPCLKCRATGSVECRKCGGTGTYTRSSYRSSSSAPRSSETHVTGTVKFYNKDKGFGFITPDSGESDVHVSRKNLQEAIDLHPGDRVEFVCRTGDKGLWAAHVTMAG